MISPDLLVCFTAPPKLNHMTGACRAANAIYADLRVPLLFNGYRAMPGTCFRASMFLQLEGIHDAHSSKSTPGSRSKV